MSELKKLISEYIDIQVAQKIALAGGINSLQLFRWFEKGVFPTQKYLVKMSTLFNIPYSKLLELRLNRKKRKQSTKINSEFIKEQTEDFLKKGGTIKKLSYVDGYEESMNRIGKHNMLF